MSNMLSVPPNVAFEKLEDDEGIEEDEVVMEEAENDDGSDSDPSIDNVPIDTVIRKGKLGSRVMSYIDNEKSGSRKKSRRSSSVKPKPYSAPKQVRKESSTVQVKKRLPPRAPMTYDRRKRDEKMEQQIGVLSSGSSQRYVPSFNRDEFDHSSPAHLKIQSIVFPADDALLSLTSRKGNGSNGREDTRGGSVRHEDNDKEKKDRKMVPHREYRREQRDEEDISSRNVVVQANDREVQFTLQAFSNRYRMRGPQVHRQAGLSSLEAPKQVLAGSNMRFRAGHHFDGVSGKIDVGACKSISALSESIRIELDNLALGMKVSGGGSGNHKMHKR